MLPRITLLAVFSLSTLPAAADLEPCTRQDLPTGARCGSVAVPLHHDRPEAGTVDLKIIVLPARKGPAALDPVFYLVGGPGTAATETVRFFGDSMTAMQQNHEVVLFDLRGTRGSGDFACTLSDAERRDVLLSFRASRGLEQCARETKNRETLRTTVFAHDLDRVRQALGAKKIHLLGVSYGTRLALEYARLYPENVRSSVLRGVTSPAVNSLAELTRGARIEFEALAKRHPGLADAYTQLIQQLDAKPLLVRGGDEEILVDGSTFEGFTRFLLYDPRTAQSLPAIITATTAGEAGPLTQVVQGLERTLQRFHIPVLLGVLCAEDVPFWELEGGNASLAEARMRKNALAACQTWSVPPVDTAFKKAVASEVPTLLLSGEHDPATPAHIAAGIAGRLTHGRHLVTPGIGHFPTWTSCYSSLVAAFFDGEELETLDVTCAAQPPSR